VLELVPSTVAAAVSADNPHLLTIGIGAGRATSGQVLVLHDMLGVTSGRLPRFVRNFMAEPLGAGPSQPQVPSPQGAVAVSGDRGPTFERGSIAAGLARYVAAVKDGSFPDESQHGY
jgi:3-methyl-2-oxobutanoate hydroxymethyltransferase